MRRIAISFLSCALGALALPAVASAAADIDDPRRQWLPSSEGAAWEWEWTNSTYAPVPTRERVEVVAREGRDVRLAWTTAGQGNRTGSVDSSGLMDLRRTANGLAVRSWSGTEPPAGFPTLCPQAEGCLNTLAATPHMWAWGSRTTALLEPLTRGARWDTTGGADQNVQASHRNLGTQRITVPAFPGPVSTTKIESRLSLPDAPPNPYAGGVRTVWWAHGVGPVRVRFRHDDGSVTYAQVTETTLGPRRAPSTADHFPLREGRRTRLRWRNSEHMRDWSVQELRVAEATGDTARVEVRDRSGPIAVRGSYVFASSLEGVSTQAQSVKAATRANFPALGPTSLPADRRRRFSTPLDLMAFGLNPVLPALPAAGDAWRAATEGPEFDRYGVSGGSEVLGRRSVRTPAGRFRAVAVRSRLTQEGFRFGSGTRTSYFAPGQGLVRLVFRHRDGSVSTVERLP